MVTDSVRCWNATSKATQSSTFSSYYPYYNYMVNGNMSIHNLAYTLQNSTAIYRTLSTSANEHFGYQIQSIKYIRNQILMSNFYTVGVHGVRKIGGERAIHYPVLVLLQLYKLHTCII